MIGQSKVKIPAYTVFFHLSPTHRHNKTLCGHNSHTKLLKKLKSYQSYNQGREPLRSLEFFQSFHPSTSPLPQPINIYQVGTVELQYITVSHQSVALLIDLSCHEQDYAENTFGHFTAAKSYSRISQSDLRLTLGYVGDLTCR